jgi:putative addiction module component (TIGR02574 family)
MSDQADKLKAQLGLLSFEDRAELTLYLLASLDEDDDPAEVAAAWDAELAKRMEEMETGKVEGIPAEVVFERIRRGLA